MDNKVITFYHSIMKDGNIDNEEASELFEFLKDLNPPPDKLVWLRAQAFKVGDDYLSTTDSDANYNVLKTINFVIHAIEKTCMRPKTISNGVPLDEDVVKTFYRSLFEGDLSVDSEENKEIYDFFQNVHPPEISALVKTRALAFIVGSEFLTLETDTNVKIFRAINVIVHAFEHICLQPKPYQLNLQVKPIKYATANTSGGDGPGKRLVMPDVGTMDLSTAVQYLWDLDDNRLMIGTDFILNIQKGKKPYWKEDAASDPLFTSVNTTVWKRPTYKAFLALLDNYIAETGVSEVITDTERREIQTFLSAIMETGPMQFCHLYCQKHATSMGRNKDIHIPSDRDAFIKILHKIWFELYKRERGGRYDSSGFEHVFVGEVKDGDVSGFHNWIQFYLEEKKGTLDYRGCIKPKDRNTCANANSDDYLLTLQFRWNDIEKFVGTSFVGVSPEFEMALYTMCFLCGNEKNHVEINTGTDIFGIIIKCYSMAYDKIGTSYPEVTTHYEE